jgi:hypothetical protein
MVDSVRMKYLSYSRRCLEAAEKVTNASERLQFLEMAQLWRSLAEKSEVVDSLVERAKDLGIVPPNTEMN